MRDLSSEHSAERQDLENTILELTKELKLRYLIIDNFVPPATRDRLQARCVFDEENDCWTLQPLERAESALENAVEYRQQRPVSVVRKG